MNQTMKCALVATVAAAIGASAAMAAPASSLAVNASAAMNGTSNGLEVIIPGKGTEFADSAYVQSAHPNGETHYRARFWIDPADLNLPAVEGANYFRFMFLNSADPVATPAVGFIARSPGSENFRILYWVRNDSNAFEFLGGTFLTSGSSPAPAQIEIEFTRATSGANGKFKLTNITNGGAFVERTNIDNGNYEIDDAFIGYLWAASNAALSGSFDFDEFESYR